MDRSIRVYRLRCPHHLSLCPRAPLHRLIVHPGVSCRQLGNAFEIIDCKNIFGKLDWLYPTLRSHRHDYSINKIFFKFNKKRGRGNIRANWMG